MVNTFEDNKCISTERVQLLAFFRPSQLRCSSSELNNHGTVSHQMLAYRRSKRTNRKLKWVYNEI